MNPTPLVQLPKKKIRHIGGDPVKTAAAANLVYVSDTQQGIRRIRKGKAFDYLLKEKKLRNREQLNRIKSLVIPPAWENVWICALENGHLQATGTDVKNRKQYKYHPYWNALRNHTKFFRMLEFGKVLPAIRLRVEQDLSLPGLSREKVLAAVVSLMERTNIRVGNNFYEKLYGSFGLTTLKDRHVNINGATVRFAFKGKKGVEHNISLINRKLSRIVKQCRDIPGRELFQYYDAEGGRHAIDSGMVNAYLKEISGQDFSAKDFRTWSGTVRALMAFKELGAYETKTEAKKKINEAVGMVSKHLGNTLAVCKKYYIHPEIINLYENGELKKYTRELDQIEEDDGKTGLTSAEQLVMKILERS